MPAGAVCPSYCFQPSAAVSAVSPFTARVFLDLLPRGSVGLRAITAVVEPLNDGIGQVSY